MTSIINTAFMKLTRRAETSDRNKIIATFVDVGPLFTLLSSKDHQVLYGRRGTGKTHALSYVAERTQKEGHATVYLDLRTIGSTGGLYADSAVPLSQRATRLLADTLTAIHDGLYGYFVEKAEELDLSRTGPLLDRLAEAINQVRVVGAIESETKTTNGQESALSTKSEFSISEKGLKAGISDSADEKQRSHVEKRTTESGVAERRVHFGSLGQVLNEIATAMDGYRVWILLDEWSSIPLDLQPYLADLLRRAAFPVRNVTVKIAAIEQRSRFRIPTGRGDYIGVELGADIAADLNLDDFMVFDNDAERSKQFFQELLFKHFKETDAIDVSSGPKTSDELIRQGFTQRNVFEEFVRATEGVPRDAINIISLAAQKSLDNPISMKDITVAARNWYHRDKAAAVRSNGEANELLNWIIDRVIEERRARAFLLRSDMNDELIDSLFDARVLHVMKRNISARDTPGIRYDVYKLDYGCYVDLRGTARAPEGLLLSELDNDEDTYLEVPPDDYRAIRRAILDLGEFKKRLPLIEV
jgi:hypothetical protein